MDRVFHDVCYMVVANGAKDSLVVPTVKGLCRELIPGIRTSRRGHRMCAVHILECINRIERVYKIDPKLTNDILYDAVIRNVQTLAESTRYIKKDIRYDHMDIPWKIIKRLRNELVHGYLTVDMDAAVRIFIVHDLPNIKKILEAHYPNWKAERKKRVLPTYAPARC